MVAATLVVTGCGDKKQATTTEENPAVLVKTAAARIEPVAQTVDYTTTLQPNLQNFICPTITAKITAIYVDVGDHVRKGQLLVELDKTQYNTYALQLSNLELTLSRYRTVYEKGGVSKQEIDDMENNVAVLRETVNDLKKNTEVRSPMDGIITGRYNDVGDLFTMTANADGGVGILQVMQTNPLKANVGVQETYFRQIKNGMPVAITVDALPGENFTGKVALINPSVNSSSRTFNVEVSVPNSANELRAGMFARATFDMGIIESVTTEDVAVQRQAGTNDKYLFVIENGKAQKRMVTTGRQIGDRVEILSGLEAGEKVAVAGISRLDTGVAVTESEEAIVSASNNAQ